MIWPAAIVRVFKIVRFYKSRTDKDVAAVCQGPELGIFAPGSNDGRGRELLVGNHWELLVRAPSRR